MSQAGPSQATVRLKAVPLLVTVALAFGLPIVAAAAAGLSNAIWQTPSPTGPALPWLYMQHGLQLLFALAAISIVKRFVDADFGLHLPRGKTYVRAAIVWGAAFGVLMTLVDYAPQIFAGAKPVLDYPLTDRTVGGWLFFEGVYVGPTEEIPFRSLLVTYLAATMPGKLRVGRFDMNWAGVIVALIFALLHAASFDVRVWPLAVGQQIYAFALGILYAYWLEKSGSVVAPIVGHNVGNLVEYALLFLWVGLL